MEMNKVVYTDRKEYVLQILGFEIIYYLRSYAMVIFLNTIASASIIESNKMVYVYKLWIILKRKQLSSSKL